MIHYVVLDADGVEVKRGVCQIETLKLQAGPSETVGAYSPSSEDPPIFRLENGVLVPHEPPVPPVPEPTYAERRAMEYPPLNEQLDMLYHDPEAWKLLITDIKARHPKPDA